MGRPNVGMMYPVWMPLQSHTPGSMPVYGAGRVIQEARRANVTYEINNNQYYGDDRMVDCDDSITGVDFEFESTGLSPEDRQTMMGESVVTGNSNFAGGQFVGDDKSPEGGLIYIEKVRDNGTPKYEVWLEMAGRYKQRSRTAQTREQSINWGSPTVQARLRGLDIDGSGKLQFEWHKEFATMAEAKACINNMAQIA